MLSSLDFWRTAAITAAAVGQTAFVLMYLTYPWWRTFLGRALFFKALTLGALADVVVVGRVWDWRYEEATFVAMYGLVAFGIWSQMIAFLRLRLRNRRER